MGSNLSRRDFCRRTLAVLMSLGVSPRLARLMAGDPEGEGPTVEVKHYKKLPGMKIQCGVCPMNCVLADGEVCFCRTRMNRGGRCLNMAYHNPSVIGIDPVEKGPFFHYLPGTRSFAMGTSGCNLRCLYCQNWEQSQKMPIETENLDLKPESVLTEAKSSECQGIMFTYTEPVMFSEYALEVSRLARKQGFKLQMATAGYCNPGPFAELCDAVDAVTVALKGFTDSFYKKVCGQKLAPVLEAIKTARRSRAWLELVTLVVPGYNDSPEEIREMSRWIVKELGPDVPITFSRFFPQYKLKNLVPTPIATLEKVREIALGEGIHHVYLANVGVHPATCTFCPRCKAEVVTRAAFQVKENRIKDGRCPACKEKIAGVWA